MRRDGSVESFLAVLALWALWDRLVRVWWALLLVLAIFAVGFWAGRVW